MATSSEAGQKVDAATLAAATKVDILATVSASVMSCHKRKSKTKDCDDRDRPHNKWGKYDSEEDVSTVSKTTSVIWRPF